MQDIPLRDYYQTEGPSTKHLLETNCLKDPSYIILSVILTAKVTEDVLI